MSAGRRRFWGWGVDGGGLGDAANESLAAMAAGLLDLAPRLPRAPPRAADLALPPARIALAGAAAERLGATADPEERAAHTYGKAFRDRGHRALLGKLCDLCVLCGRGSCDIGYVGLNSRY